MTAQGFLRIRRLGVQVPSGARVGFAHPELFADAHTIEFESRPPMPTTDGGDTTSRLCMLIRMQSTSVRIDVVTHLELKRLAAELHTTVGNTVSLAVRALRQDRVGDELSAPLRTDETAWLDADLG